MDASDETDAFLLESVAYCVDTMGMNKDELVFELVNGIVGDYYPSPSRCLSLTEMILGDYLQSVLYDGKDLKARPRSSPPREARPPCATCLSPSTTTKCSNPATR